MTSSSAPPHSDPPHINMKAKGSTKKSIRGRSASSELKKAKPVWKVSSDQEDNKVTVKENSQNVRSSENTEESSSTSLELSESLLKSSSSSAGSEMTGESSSGGGPSSTDSTRPLVRPPISYAMLITEAIQQSPEKQLILSEIYDYVKGHYPYFKTAGSGWKNSIRHNLSLNKSFCKVPRPQRVGGKGSYWKLVDSMDGRRKSEHEGILRRQSFPGFIGGRYPLPLYPLSSERTRQRTLSEPGGKLPILRPRPATAEMLAFPMDVPVEGETIWPPFLNLDGAAPAAALVSNSKVLTDLSRPVVDSNTDTFGTSSYGGTPSDPDPSSLFYQDVWLGAGTPKQHTLEKSSSPGVLLLAANPDKGRTPPSFASFLEPNSSLMPFTGYL